MNFGASICPASMSAAGHEETGRFSLNCETSALFSAFVTASCFQRRLIVAQTLTAD